ncbi:hypothetical protein BH11ACT7_BH11ACT7_39720 [soil metagenome]
MGTPSRNRMRVAVLSFGLVSAPAVLFATPAISSADDGCGLSMYYNTATAQCEYCDVLYYDVATDQCAYWDNPTVYINPNPVIGPVGPGPVGPGPVGPGPVGPGPVGPGPVGPGRR